MKICRRKRDSPEVEGWIALHDPELPLTLPVGAEVRPRTSSDARLSVGRSDGGDAVEAARNAFVTKVSSPVVCVVIGV